jgi:acylphosphatase
MPRLHAIICGRVQGVFFRASIIEQARSLGLQGWVRNRLDGSVEVVAEGDAAAIDALRSYCKKGPPGAIVRDFEVIDEPETGEFESFDVRMEA